MTVTVIQYFPPNGIRGTRLTEITDELKNEYDDMKAKGYQFEAEVLSTGEVSVTISKDEDIDIEIVPNGPMVQKALEQMLRRKKWL